MKPSERIKQIMQGPLVGGSGMSIDKATAIEKYLDEQYEADQPCQHEWEDIKLYGLSACKKCHIMSQIQSTPTNTVQEERKVKTPTSWIGYWVCDDCGFDIKKCVCQIPDTSRNKVVQDTKEVWFEEFIGDMRVAFPEIYSARHQDKADLLLKTKIEKLVAQERILAQKEMIEDILEHFEKQVKEGKYGNYRPTWDLEEYTKSKGIDITK